MVHISRNFYFLKVIVWSVWFAEHPATADASSLPFTVPATMFGDDCRIYKDQKITVYIDSPDDESVRQWGARHTEDIAREIEGLDDREIPEGVSGRHQNPAAQPELIAQWPPVLMANRCPCRFCITKTQLLMVVRHCFCMAMDPTVMRYPPALAPRTVAPSTHPGWRARH